MIFVPHLPLLATKTCKMQILLTSKLIILEMNQFHLILHFQYIISPILDNKELKMFFIDISLSSILSSVAILHIFFVVVKHSKHIF